MGFLDFLNRRKRLKQKLKQLKKEKSKKIGKKGKLTLSNQSYIYQLGKDVTEMKVILGRGFKKLSNDHNILKDGQSTVITILRNGNEREISKDIDSAKKILETLGKKGNITSANLSNQLGYHPKYVSNVLSMLVKSGRIDRKRIGRNIFYSIIE